VLERVGDAVRRAGIALLLRVVLPGRAARSHIRIPAEFPPGGPMSLPFARARARRRAALAPSLALSLAVALGGAAGCQKERKTETFALGTVNGRPVPAVVTQTFDDGSEERIEYRAGTLVLDRRRHTFTMRVHFVETFCDAPPTGCEAPAEEDEPVGGRFEQRGNVITFTFDGDGDSFEFDATIENGRVTFDVGDEMFDLVLVFVKSG
jgi:hypothetical protein